MNRWDPLFFIAGAVIVAFASDLAARQKAGGDSGSFWARVTKWTCIWLGLPLLLVTTALPSVAVIANYAPANSRTWLLIVFSAWLVLLCVGLLWKDASGGIRWLAGSVGFSRRRFWIAGFAIVLLPALYAGLEAWPEPNYAANWGLAALLTTTIVYISLSVPAKKPVQAEQPKAVATVSAPDTDTRDWIAVMRAAGIEVETLRSIAPEPNRPVADGILDWQSQLEAMGSYGVAAELLEAVRRIIDPKAGDARSCLILAADHSGQQEALMLAAAELSRSRGEVTLIITPDDHVRLAESLRMWIAAGAAPVAVEPLVPGSQTFQSADIGVVDVAGLSDQLLSQFREELDRTDRPRMPLLERIGMVVWWDTHQYSGVRAGNVWAISRRLARMLDTYGRPQVRVLMFARLAAHAIAETSAFVGHLLPYPIARKDEIRVPARAARRVEVHRGRSPLAGIAAASVRHGFSTAVDATDRSELEAIIGQTQVDGKPLRKQLTSSLNADVGLIQLKPADILAVPELAAAAGRSGNAARPRHVVLIAPHNPYIDYVLEKYRSDGATSSSCYLAGATGRAELIQRHVQQALREKKDTLAGLVSAFRWDEAVLERTLSDLSSRGQLHRSAARYLDAEGRLKLDYMYSSLEPQGAAGRPLETVGVDLVEVRDPAVAGPSGLHLRVDRDRLAIDAYPGRVFTHAGRRYRIKNWSNASAIERIDCMPEDLEIQTWRLRNARLRRLRRESPPMQMTAGLRRFAVSADYREELTGLIEQTGQGALRPIHLALPEYTEFSTRALVLAPVVSTDPDALYVLAMALRHMLPVHVGVDEGYLEVVRLSDAQVEGEKRVSGLAFVDLLPGGGIGLIDAIEESDALVRTLLSSCLSWLTEAARQRDSAENLFASTPIAAATGSVAGFKLTPAIRLLSALISERAART